MERGAADVVDIEEMSGEGKGRERLRRRSLKWE